jgi:hypothetical protein
MKKFILFSFFSLFVTNAFSMQDQQLFYKIGNYFMPEEGDDGTTEEIFIEGDDDTNVEVFISESLYKRLQEACDGLERLMIETVLNENLTESIQRLQRFKRWRARFHVFYQTKSVAESTLTILKDYLGRVKEMRYTAYFIGKNDAEYKIDPPNEILNIDENLLLVEELKGKLLIIHSWFTVSCCCSIL